MSEELQSEEVVDQVVSETTEAQTSDEGADLAPAEPEKVVFSDEQQ